MGRPSPRLQLGPVPSITIPELKGGSAPGPRPKSPRRGCARWSPSTLRSSRIRPMGIRRPCRSQSRSSRPAATILPHTYQTRDFAPTLAARMDRAIVTGVTAIKTGERGKPLFVQPMFQGKLSADIRAWCRRPLISRPIGSRAFRAPDQAKREERRRQSGVARITVDASAIREKPEPPFSEEPDGLWTFQAERIVSVGRGIKEQATSRLRRSWPTRFRRSSPRRSSHLRPRLVAHGAAGWRLEAKLSFSEAPIWRSPSFGRDPASGRDEEDRAISSRSTKIPRRPSSVAGFGIVDEPVRKSCQRSHRRPHCNSDDRAAPPGCSSWASLAGAFLAQVATRSIDLPAPPTCLFRSITPAFACAALMDVLAQHGPFVSGRSRASLMRSCSGDFSRSPDTRSPSFYTALASPISPTRRGFRDIGRCSRRLPSPCSLASCPPLAACIRPACRARLKSLDRIGGHCAVDYHVDGDVSSWLAPGRVLDGRPRQLVGPRGCDSCVSRSDSLVETLSPRPVADHRVPAIAGARQRAEPRFREGGSRSRDREGSRQQDVTGRRLRASDAGGAEVNLPGVGRRKELNPKTIILQTQQALLDGPREAKLGEIYSEKVLWQCTTCGACENQCPVGIEHLPLIIGARRRKASPNGDAPAHHGRIGAHSLRRLALTTEGLGYDPAAEVCPVGGTRVFRSARHDVLVWRCAGAFKRIFKSLRSRC